MKQTFPHRNRKTTATLRALLTVAALSVLVATAAPPPAAAPQTPAPAPAGTPVPLRIRPDVIIRPDVTVRSIRSLTYYHPVPWGQFTLPPFEAALEDIRRLGGNTVWLILPWHQFQPVALPQPQWDQAALDHLEQAVAAAEKRGMNVIAPLCYLGVGWSPKGIDSRIWTVDSAMYGAFSRYALELIGKLGAHRNLIYLLYTEGCEPVMESLRQFPQAGESFRAWCRALSPDLFLWNARWGTDYTEWRQVQPINYATDRGNWRRVEDHYRWVAAVLRQSHGALARRIRPQIKGKALLGYHDYSLIARDYAKGDTPIPPDQPYDFLSLACYDNPSYKTTAQYEAALRQALARGRQCHPKLPLAVLEAGSSSSDASPQRQADAIRMVAGQARLQGIGLNIWMWKDMNFPSAHRATYGLVDKDGKPKPAYEALKKAWAPAP